MTKSIRMQKSALRLVAVFVAMIMTFLMLPMRSLAATETYTVTFSAGSVAKFDQSVIDTYVEKYGEACVEVSEATGNIKITVEAGAETPDAPDAVVFNEAAEGKYVINTAWRPTEETVTKNVVYVVKYDRLTSGVEYTVKYVDAESGMQLAIPVIVLGNLDSTVTYTAKAIDGYTVDAQTAKLTLVNDASKNVITFKYTAIPVVQPAQEQPAQNQQGQVAGEQFTNTNNNTNTADANQGTTTESSAAVEENNGTNNGTTTTEPASSVAEGEEEGEVLGSQYENPLNRYLPFVIGGIVIVMAGAMVVLVVTKSKADKVSK